MSTPESTTHGEPDPDPDDDGDGDGAAGRTWLDVEIEPQQVSAIVTGLLNDVDQLGKDVNQLGKDLEWQRRASEALIRTVNRIQQATGESTEVSKRPSRWVWPYLTREQAQQLWTEVTGWVEEVLMSQDLPRQVQIAPCWYRHTVAIEELTALYAAWLEAHCAGDEPTDRMAAFRRYHLWPCLEFLSAAVGWKECLSRGSHVNRASRSSTDDGLADHITADLANRDDQPPRPAWYTAEENTDPTTGSNTGDGAATNPATTTRPAATVSRPHRSPGRA
jgi:hypothetical protein